MGENISSTNTMPEGAELLNGLYTVSAYLQNANEKLTQYWNLEREYRYEVAPRLIEMNTPREKSEYGLFVSGMAFAGICGVISLLGGGVINFILCLIIVGVFALGKAKQNKKFLKIAKVLLVALLLVWLNGLFNAFSTINTNFLGVVFYLVINVGAFVAASIGAKIIRDKYNKKQQDIADEKNKDVIKNNELVTRQRTELANDINALLAEMQDKTASWYPADYYVIECCSKFIGYVKNHEADTVKEMLKTYKEDKYREQVTTKLSSIEGMVNRSLKNQQQMIRLQRFSNLVQMGNLAVNLANNQAINRGANATERAANATERAANATERAAKELKWQNTDHSIW